jgi:hypothetical protein
VIAKLRAGGFYIVLGNNEFGMIAEIDYNTTIGVKDTPGTKLILSDECLHKALVLANFLGDNSLPPTISNSTITNVSRVSELIDFDSTSDTIISWTSDRVAKFGNYPTIEIWAWDDTKGAYYKADIPIDAVGDPPTSFIIRNSG